MAILGVVLLGNPGDGFISDVNLGDGLKKKVDPKRIPIKVPRRITAALATVFYSSLISWISLARFFDVASV